VLDNSINNIFVGVL